MANRLKFICKVRFHRRWHRLLAVRFIRAVPRQLRYAHGKRRPTMRPRWACESDAIFRMQLVNDAMKLPASGVQ